MTILLKTLKKENDLIPIWFMRQAGRYLPEYMEVRKNFSDFLDLCFDSKNAAKVTMQPILRYDFDAAIIFSDILVLPHVLGWNVAFKKGEGPILQKFKSEEDFLYLNDQFDDRVNRVYDTVSLVRSSLNRSKSLIGFAGSPWTVMSYMLEGKGKQDFSVSKKLIYNQRGLLFRLVDFLTENTVRYLLGQIRAGVDVIQLFDSWSGVLQENEFDDFVIRPTAHIVKSIKTIHPDIPIIGFPRGSGYLYQKYIDETGIDAVGVDQFVPVSVMGKWTKKVAVQGNFDPVALLSNKDVIKQKANNILSVLKDKNFIFNLGHGILPSTPLENVEFLVNYVRNYQK